jgi:inositol phosphorylceramide mannosyltransferase catalytic subunit
VIPERIIQTGPADLPLRLKAGMANARLLNPEFEYLFFDDAKVESFIEEQCQEWRDAYRRYRFKIQRFDFFRYLAVYRLGGFYMDLDVFLAEPLRPLLSPECVFAFEELTDSPFFWERFQMDWQIANYAFGSEPGHPFLAAIIENCLRAQRDPAWVKPMMSRIPRPFYDEYLILNTTGPGLVSRTFAENPSLAQRVHVAFPEDVLDPRTWHQFGTFGIHDMVGSWRTPPTVLSLPLRKLWASWRFRHTMSRSTTRGTKRCAGSVQPIPERAC